MTEIKVCPGNFHLERQRRKKENDKKVRVTLTELLPALLALYENFYDINLQIYKAERNLTVIDFRYYPKSSLDQEYLKKVLHNPPMLHCKIEQPPWLRNGKKRFDINWEHKQWLINWKLCWARLTQNNRS